MRFVWSLLAVVLISGCSPIYYAPNTLNVPMIREKGEGVFGGYIGDPSSVSIQGAYSPKQNWAIMADGVWGNDASSGTSGSGHLITGGAGYYRPLNNHFMFDTYGILGLGSVENQLSQGNVSSGFVRYGIQPSTGFQSKYFEANVASRLVALRYFHTNGSNAAEVAYLKGAGTQFLFEPALTVRGGFDAIKAQLQYGHSYNFTDSNFKMDEEIISFGLIFRFKRK